MRTLIGDALIWSSGLAIVAVSSDMLVGCFGALLLFIGCARLFILGHDACHGSFSRNERINEWVGHIALLPSLTPRQSWVVGHNVAHHGYNNLRGFDYVWAPKSVDEYSRLSKVGQLKYDIYRSGWAPGLYYLVEIWWKKLFFPRHREVGSSKPEFFWHSVFVAGFLAAWLLILTLPAILTKHSLGLALLWGFAMPFLMWNALIGFVVYVHHTDPSTRWYQTKAAWAEDQAFMTATPHIVFRYPFSRLLHNIMEHTAHHLDLSIPFYRLVEAQRVLSKKFPGRVMERKFSAKWYFEVARQCHFYDFQNHRWVSHREMTAEFQPRTLP